MIYFVGEVPGRRYFGFGSGAWGRLSKMLGVDLLRELRDGRVVLTHLCWSGWNDDYARRQAALLASHRRTVVAMGRKVAKSFGLGEAPFFTSHKVRSAKVLVVPNPSGRCRLWNDRRNAARFARFIKDAAGGRLRSMFESRVT